MDITKKKKTILKALARVTNELRGDKSQFMFACENDISTSILSTIERAMKDPQITTIFKLAEAFNIKPSRFVKLIEEQLPDDFYMIEK